MAEKETVAKPAGRALLLAVENAQIRQDLPEIRSGDTVRLQVKVVEGNRERLQPFEGVVMRVRGQQLYYLRGLTGKAARLKEVRPMSAKEVAAKEAAQAAKAAAKEAAIKEAAAQAAEAEVEMESSEETED